VKIAIAVPVSMSCRGAVHRVVRAHGADPRPGANHEIRVAGNGRGVLVWKEARS